MSKKRKGQAKSRMSAPTLEALEDRLLLTTLTAGHFFVYQNSQGESVRVELLDPSGIGASVELFAFDNSMGGLVDLVGLYDGKTTLDDQVLWAQEDTLPILDPATNAWAVRPAAPPDPPTMSLRGAKTEIFAIYVASADAQTVLSISTLAAANPGGNNWADDITEYGSTLLPLIDLGGKAPVKTPAGSGGVLIGARANPDPGDSTATPPVVGNLDRFTGVSQTDDYEWAPKWGAWPGGPGGDYAPLNAGITIASGISALYIPNALLGTDVQAVASTGGNAYAVDSAVGAGQIVGPNYSLGDATGLAADATGLMFTADSLPRIKSYAPVLGVNVPALAANNAGTIYGVNGTTHTLFRTTPGGVVTPIGTGLFDTVTATWRYDNVFGLDFHPLTGGLYGIGTVTDTAAAPAPPDPAGPYLMTINTATGRVAKGPQVTGTGITAATTFASVAFAPDGTLYAVNAQSNELVTVDLASGAATVVGVLRDAAATPVLGIAGIEFVYSATGAGTSGAMYAVDGNQKMYTVSSTGVCTQVLATGLATTALTYDPTRPGKLFVTKFSGTNYALAEITLGASLLSVDDATGEGTPVAVMTEASDATLVLTDIGAMDFSPAGALYAVATVVDLNPEQAPSAPAGRQWVTINTATGKFTVVAAISGAADLTGIAFKSDGSLYGVNGNTLYTVNPTTGVATGVAGMLPAGGFTGLQFVQYGATGPEILYGATGGGIYQIDTAAPGGSLQLSDSGLTTLSSLAYDATHAGYLWATAGVSGSRLVQIPLASTLVMSTPAGTVTRLGLLVDSVDPLMYYTNVHAMDFNGSGVLWAVGAEATFDALNAGGVTPGPYLLTIDEATGVVTQVAALSPSADLSSIAFDGSGVLWGVSPADELVTLDTAGLTAGTVTVQFPLSVTEIAGIAFDSAGVLYGVDGTSLYTIDLLSGSVTLVKGVGVAGMSSLSADALDDTHLYSTVPDPNSGLYQLISIDLTGGGDFDMGRIIVGGTVCGTISNYGGSFDVIRVGYLWSKVAAWGNIGTLITQQGGAGLQDPSTTPPAWVMPTNVDDDVDAWIIAGGKIQFVNVLGGTLYSFIDAINDPAAPVDSDIVYELESGTARVAAAGFDRAWLDGQIVGYDNNSQANAQFLSTSTGNFDVYGDLLDEPATFTFASRKTRVLGSTPPAYAASYADWYGLPLMAGQTVTIDGWVGAYPFSETMASANLYDSAGYLMDTLGYAEGPIVFTAPAADVYYIVVYEPPPLVGDGGDRYVLEITGGTAAALGAVAGAGFVDGWFNTRLPAYHSATPSTIYDVPNIAVENGGNLGAVAVSSTIRSVIRVYGSGLVGGDLIAYAVGSSAWDNIASDGNIGSVSSAGGLASVIYAGYGNGNYNHDAYIQNIRVGGTITAATSLYAAGSIGVIDVGGDMGGITLEVNYDGIGTPGKVDLINVKGNWGGLGLGIPALKHGVGGDFGFINVAGTIWVFDGAIYSPVTPTTYSDGRTVTLNDDGGGRMTVAPHVTPVVDLLTGLPRLDAYGQPMMFTPTTSFIYIGVDDDSYPGVGVGGVIANLIVDGSATFTASGVVQISDLDITQNPNANGSLTFGGAGRADVYYVHATSAISAFVNSTLGNVVSGTLGAVASMIVKGSIGAMSGSVGEWLHGREAAPVVANLKTEPKYGWFNGSINGLDVASIDSLRVDGSLGDLRATGKIGTVAVNADGLTMPGQWDGVNGVVWSRTRIDSLAVGDGLSPTGAADAARAGIFSTISIGTVSIVGPSYTSNGLVYGQLRGAIIGASNDVLMLPGPTGTLVPVSVDAITQVVGTKGAVTSAMIAATDLDHWMPISGQFIMSGGIGTVSFSGPGAAITGSAITPCEILGLYVRSVLTSADSDGISYARISGISAPANSNAIGQIVAGGPGMHDSTVIANGGGIGTVKGLGPIADMRTNTFVATDGMVELSGRNLLENDVHMPGTVGKFAAAAAAMDNTLLVGAIKAVSTGGDFAGNEVTVAGELTSMTIGGAFEDSSLILQGPTVANLRSLVVYGDISGTILSAARIGKIISQTGAITADVSTAGSGPNSNVDLIQVAAGYTGTLKVGGSLGKFVSAVSLGSNPEDAAGRTQKFDIWGNLGLVQVGGKKAPANLYADFAVGGNVGTLDIAGTLYGNLVTNGNLGVLKMTGGLGGMLDLDGDGTLETKRGQVYVLGSIGSISIPTNQDILADLTTGGTIKGITLKGGSIVGNIESRYGNITNLSLTNGSIQGALTANRIDKVSVTNGNIAGDITVRNGSLKSLTLKNGALIGNITVENGRIDALSLVGAATTAGKTISASGGIGSVSVSGGSLAANLLSRRDLGKVSVAGGDLTGNVWAQTTLGQISVTGKIGGNVVAGKILKVSAGSLENAVVSSSRDIVQAAVKGGVTGSKILAGLNIDEDYAVGGADDVLQSGSVIQLKIGGTMTDSIVAAGVGPGADNDFTTILGNTLAGGSSSIVKMTVGAVAGVNGLLAEATVDTNAVAAMTPGDVVYQGAPGSAIAPGPSVFGPGVGNNTLIVPLAGGALTLTLTGAGEAQYDDATGALIFAETTSRSSLSIVNTDPATPKTLTITGANGDGLGSLKAAGNVVLGDVIIDGAVGTFQVPAALAGAAWQLLGGVKAGSVGNPQDVDVTVGPVTAWIMGGNYGAGTFQAQSVGTFTVAGNLAGTLDVAEAVKSISVSGNLAGAVDVWGTVGSIAVGGAFSGSVEIYCGDLSSLTVGNGMTGTVDVAQQVVDTVTYGGGIVGSVAINGNFGGSADTSFRASGGVGAFKVTGNFTGLLSTDGELKTLSVTGVMSGRAWAGRNVGTVSLGAMSGGQLFSSCDVGTVNIAGDMLLSSIYSGFDPGDAGYDAGAGGEAANLQVDALTLPANRTPGNADEVTGGSVGKVAIGGNMDRSTISGAVGPGPDGFVGTGDDRVAGVGTVGTVRVGRFILGSANAGQSFGVFAASNVPTVFFLNNRPFLFNGNAVVGTMISVAGGLSVDNLMMGANSIVIYLSHAIDSSTINAGAFQLIGSVDNSFATAGDNIDLAGMYLVGYNSSNFTVTLVLATGTWADSGAGNYFQLTMRDTVRDNRGNQLDGDFSGLFPTGDNVPGGDFVYEGVLTDTADDFAGATDILPLVVDGGMLALGNQFDTANDVDVFHFTASAWDFFSMQLSDGALTGEMGLFYDDTQGTATQADDTFEAVARYEYQRVSGDTLFQAVELSETGDYYVVVTQPQPPMSWSANPGSYSLMLNLTSTDQKLVAQIGGELPSGEEIGYVSNTVGQHNNLLGTHAPKQLVYLNFNGGTTTKYAVNSAIGAMKADELDTALAGMETALIDGGGGVTGIVDDILSIYRNTPASYPDGELTVERVDLTNPADLAAFNAAADGLWFTTVDPTLSGLNPDTDFTTVFIGSADDRPYRTGGGLLGIASDIDLMGMQKADNAVVFSNNFRDYSTATGTLAMLNEYARAIANTAAHELGHTLGLNHQPTDRKHYMLFPRTGVPSPDPSWPDHTSDDPDNNPATPDDSNQGSSLMGYTDALRDCQYLHQLGTMELTPTEFVMGDIDTVDLILKWLK